MTVKEYVDEHSDIRMEIQLPSGETDFLDYGKVGAYGNYEIIDYVPDWGWCLDLLYIKDVK